MADDVCIKGCEDCGCHSSAECSQRQTWRCCSHHCKGEVLYKKAHGCAKLGGEAGTATRYKRYWKDDVSLVILSNDENIEVADLSSAIEEALENT